MKNRVNIFALSAAVLSGGLAFYSLNRKALELRQRSTPVTVLTAARYIPAQSALYPDMVQKKEIPESFVSPSAIHDLRELDGLTTLAPISEGEQIMANKFATSGESLASGLSSGFRAYTLEVNETTGVGNLLNFGDHVNLLPKNTTKGRQEMTAFVFQNIQVLAVGRKTGRIGPVKNVSAENGEGGGAERVFAYSTVTLAVTPDQAETLMFLDGAASLRLLLRAPGDDEIVSVPRQEEGQILNRLGRFAQPKARKIEVIHGLQESKGGVQ
jgi:pilus assembly protein CpaB